MRHPLLLAGGVSLAALAGAVALARSAPADAPALFRGDLAHTGVYRAAPLTRFGGVQWRVATDGRTDGRAGGRSGGRGEDSESESP